jgi:hypothetical protein
MSDLPSALLTLTGFAALSVGLGCGRPLVRAINRNQGEDRIRGWRVAHSSLIMGGIMLLVIALVLRELALPDGWRLAAAVLLSISIVSFGYALIVGPWRGFRGLRKEGGLAALSVYYANVAGAALTLAGIGILLVGAARSMIATMSG